MAKWPTIGTSETTCGIYNITVYILFNLGTYNVNVEDPKFDMILSFHVMVFIFLY